MPGLLVIVYDLRDLVCLSWILSVCKLAEVCSPAPGGFGGAKMTFLGFPGSTREIDLECPPVIIQAILGQPQIG